MQLLWLGDPAATDRRLVGGKAASLARLQRNHPVPDGFCLTTAAYNGPGRTEDTMDSALAAAVAGAYGQLGARSGQRLPRVAVRSSGVDEDGGASSFAGQYETYLNLVGPEAVIDAVERCWASARSERAQAYRQQQGLEGEGALAVLVQLQVMADTSGVAFSINPVTGARDEVTINASWGLGESVVGGTVTPDTFRVSRSDLSIIGREIAAKERMTVALSGGTEEVPVPAFLRSEPTLTDEQVQQVAALVVALEQEHAFPVDVEYAFEAGRLSLLQCRPVTVRPAPAQPKAPAEFPVNWESPEEEACTWRQDLIHFPDQVPPLFGSFLGLMCEGAAAAAAAGGAPRDQMRYSRFNTYVYATMLPEKLDPEEHKERRHQYGEYLLALSERLGAFWQEEMLPALKELLHSWRELSPATAGPGELPALLAENRRRFVRAWDLHFQLVFTFGIAINEFDDLYGELFGEGSLQRCFRLLQGLDNKTLEGNRGLWRLSRIATARPPVAAVLKEAPAGEAVALLKGFGEGRAFLAELDEWLATYGCRFEKWDFSQPTWQEEPAPAIRAIQGYLNQPDHDPEADLAALAAEREAAVAEARRQLEGYPRPVRERFDRLLQSAQAASWLKEEHNYWIDYRCNAEARRVLMALGGRLAGAGVLAQADDVWYLTLPELEATAADYPGPDRRPLVAERRAEMARWRGAALPSTLGTPPKAPAAPAPEDALTRSAKKFERGSSPAAEPGLLRGHAASAGRVRGLVKILQTEADSAKLRPGDILVARTTAPPWTPLFATAGAVVTDAGGILSHCAVIAREYRIPAVVGTGKATKMLQEGQLVEVDGSEGTVRVIAGE